MKTWAELKAELVENEYEPTLKGLWAQHCDQASSGNADLYVRDFGLYEGEKPWYSTSVWLDLRSWGLGIDVSRFREARYVYARGCRRHVVRTDVDLTLGPFTINGHRERWAK